jgi:hypothetical protein
VSATGANVFKHGFDHKDLDVHFGSGGAHDHSEEYPGYTKELYAQEALELIQKPVGGDIRGHINKWGQISRYDKSNNNFVKGHPNKRIYTMFKPSDGEAYYDLILGLETRKENKDE